MNGLWTLFRFVPVLSWGVTATVMGVAAAAGTASWRLSYLGDGLLVLAGAMAFQGIVAHGLNDLEDWRSGTDALSPGLLSGGSRVIPRRLLTEKQVGAAARLAAAVGLACAGVLYLRHGPAVLPVAAVALWSSIAYTQAPLRLAYLPFIGELAAGWPAVITIVVGTTAVLTGGAGPGVWAAGAVQSTFSVAWVMQHHLPDLWADLAATPPKVTTPAWVARRWGGAAARLVPAGYFLIGTAVSAGLALTLHPVFWGSAALGALGAREALTTDVTSVPDITRRQLKMIALTGANAALLVLGFLAGGLATVR